MNVIYPFGAVVGQEPLKLALLLAAIDPAIGGVLVRGPRGVAKTTLARALAELVPGRFVELPLGATEERVTGTLDLGSALREGKVEFAPGLLARAHEGVLYVDEVNLLPDAIVDLLLDAAATGVNVVERDGVSHRHAARFVLVGTMNPDEGELRPQLTDRFGLAVSADAALAPAERVAIVARRLEFESDPEGFVARHAETQRALIERCQSARARLPAIPLAGEALALVAERCFAARVEGVRADLAMLRAARAHAAWYGRAQIGAEDVDAVAELALNHRRPHERGPDDDGGASSSGSGAGGGATRGSPTSDSGTARGAAAAAGANGAPDGDRGALPAVPVRAVRVPELPPWLCAGQALRPRDRATFATRPPRARRRARPQPTRSIDWFATLARCRTPGLRDLRYRRRPAARALLVLALDCSSSMLRGGALAAAKGIAQALLDAPGSARTELALIAFSGARASACIARASRARFERALADLGAGGGTPLRRALIDALALGRRADLRGAPHKRLLLFTDGRTREPAGDLHALRAAFEVSVIDCERTRVRLGRARAIARELDARYAHVERLLPGPRIPGGARA